VKSVCEIVKAYAGQVGLKPADFGAHSLRAGLLTSAARRGASVFKMRDVSRHKPMALINLVYRDQLFPHRAYARAFEALLRFTPWGSAAAELSFDLLGRPAAIAWRTRGGGHPGTIFTAARFHCQWDEPVLPTIHHRRSSADYWDAGRLPANAATRAGFCKKLSQADGGQADGSTRPWLFTAGVTSAGLRRGRKSSKCPYLLVF
jgi:hypothetical protein